MIKNQSEAEEKAKKLWGENAFVLIAGPSYFVVGETHGPLRQTYGSGQSWDEAFKSAKLNFN